MILSYFSRICIALVTWLGLNLLIFVVPGLGWVQYPILLNIEVLLIIFFLSSIVDQPGWFGWLCKYNSMYSKLDSMTQDTCVEESQRIIRFKRIFLFLTVSILWGIEIGLHRLVFSTVFTTTMHYVDSSGNTNVTTSSDKEEVFVCLEGTMLFGIRQLTLVVVSILTLMLECGNLKKGENYYSLRTLGPAIFLSAGGFAAVVDNASAHITAKQYTIAFLWIFIRAIRLTIMKKLQGNGMNRLGTAKIIRTISPVLLLILLIFFFIFEYPGIRRDQFEGGIADHLLRLCVYGMLFFASWMLLLEGGNATDFSCWIMFREVVWNTACVYVVGSGINNLRTLSISQILGLAFFLCAWCTYVAMYLMKMESRASFPPISFNKQLEEVSMEEYVAAAMPHSNIVLEMHILPSQDDHIVNQHKEYISTNTTSITTTANNDVVNDNDNLQEKKDM